MKLKYIFDGTENQFNLNFLNFIKYFRDTFSKDIKVNEGKCTKELDINTFATIKIIIHSTAGSRKDLVNKGGEATTTAMNAAG